VTVPLAPVPGAGPGVPKVEEPGVAGSFAAAILDRSEAGPSLRAFLGSGAGVDGLNPEWEGPGMGEGDRTRREAAAAAACLRSEVLEGAELAVVVDDDCADDEAAAGAGPSRQEGIVSIGKVPRT